MAYYTVRRSPFGRNEGSTRRFNLSPSQSVGPAPSHVTGWEAPSGTSEDLIVEESCTSFFERVKEILALTSFRRVGGGRVWARTGCGEWDWGRALDVAHSFSSQTSPPMYPITTSASKSWRFNSGRSRVDQPASQNGRMRRRSGVW